MSRSKTLVIATDAFLDKLDEYSKRFKQQNGFGRWLKEYEDMDTQGLFEPTEVRRLYVEYIRGEFPYGYIYSAAIYYIAVMAYDDTVSYLNNNEFCILNNDGSDYIDEDGDELTDLEFSEAISICKSINNDALDYVVYIADSVTKKLVYRI